MSEAIWDRLKDDGFGLNLQAGELVFSDPRRALLRAEVADSTGKLQEMVVRLFRDETNQREIVNRFLEATYLEHPHLVRYIKAGALESDEGAIAYAVTEPNDVWGSRSLALAEAIEFAQHVISALEYLHARDLVYSVLSTETVVPVGSDWKLSDFSQLRVSGTDTSDEALSLAGRVDTCPPEAAEGHFSPAWDVWAFGQTLRSVLRGYRAHMLEPFKSVILACLNVNPSARPSLSHLSGLLQRPPSDDRERGLSTAAGAR